MTFQEIVEKDLNKIELFEFMEIQDKLEYFDCFPICLYNGIWYIYYEKAKEIEILDYFRTDIRQLPRHIYPLTYDEIPKELFFDKKWFWVPQDLILKTDCFELAKIFDKKYLDAYNLTSTYKYPAEHTYIYKFDEDNFIC